MEDAPAIERGPHQTMAPIDVLFARQAAATPEAVAAIDDDTRVTYRELQALADRWARRLEMTGVRAGDAVGVSVGRSPASIAIMLGIMAIGGICVPVDRKLPTARRRAMLADSHANVIVATENDDPAVGTDGAITVVTAPADASVAANADRRSVRRESQLTDTWCLLYTSGVTGKPKGVRVTHRQVVSYLAWMWETHPFRPDDVSLLHTSPMLIASAWDCFGPLLQGIPSVVLSERDATNPSAILRRSIECGVTHLSASPGLWQAILDQPSRDLTRWRTLRVGFSRGDQLRVSTVRAWRAAFPGGALLNAYGSTECWRPTTYDTRELEANATVTPIGRPLPGVSVHVVDADLREVAPGDVGEICVAGICLASGYHGLPELTASRFVANPFDGRYGPLLYRTGDLGRRRDDGSLVVVGRNDQQVTIRGYRVELGEVECALRDCRGVRDAVVVSPVREDGGRELVAYVVPAVARLDGPKLRRILQRKLPPYMVPSAFNVVEALPLTASGKVDRMALLAGSSPATDRRPPAAARWQTPTEELLARLWSEVMPIAGADRGDGFLDLGGDSIMAMRLLGRVSDSFEVDISLEDLFSNATVPDLAEKIDARRTMVL